MYLALRLHPESRLAAPIRVGVDVTRPDPGGLLLRYAVTGGLGGLRLPAAAAPARGDGLWRHTCFEAFLRVSPGAAYYELNFAPSLQWAAYRFSGYRSGMSIAEEVGVPRLEARPTDTCYELQAAVELDGVPGLPGDAPWRLGLSAVIEETSGHLSYWALAHPTGRPDFHHSDCFALELPAA